MLGEDGAEVKVSKDKERRGVITSRSEGVDERAGFSDLTRRRRLEKDNKGVWTAG